MAKRGRPKLIYKLPPLLDYEIEKIGQLVANGMSTEVAAKIYGVPEKHLLKATGLARTPKPKKPKPIKPGTRCYRKLSDDGVREVRRLAWLMPHKEVAAKFGIALSYIREITSGRRRANVI